MIGLRWELLLYIDVLSTVYNEICKLFLITFSDIKEI